MFYLEYCSVSLCIVGSVQGQQCPSNANVRNFFGPQSYPVPLSNSFCFRCCFATADPPCPTDIVWSISGTVLTNGSMNGDVLINPTNNRLILPNPGNVLDVGSVLLCNSVSGSFQYGIIFSGLTDIESTRLSLNVNKRYVNRRSCDFTC